MPGCLPDPTGSELIRLGDYAMFRMRGVPVVARIGRHEGLLPDAKREVDVARWLVTAELPAVRALDVDQPVLVDGRVVTFWESAADRPQYGMAVELAELLRHLHA